MNTARLRAFVNGHKPQLAIAGVLVVGAAALYARKRSALAGAGSSTTNSSTSGAGSAGTYSAYGQTVPYDSSATDVYNALQPQIEQLQQMASTIPVSTTAPTSQGYFRRSGTAAIYQALSDGTLKFVDQGAWRADGTPAPIDLPATDALWARAVTGTDAPANVKTGMG